MRTETKTRTLFTYDELSDEAKAKARDWWRDCEARSGDNFFAECVIEDADTIAEILGITVDRRGKHSPAIFWSGFWSQGDGACFEGSYSYAKGATKAIRRHAPKDTELHRIADELAKVQRRYFYALSATCEHRGHYQHSGCMAVHTYYDNDGDRNISDDDDETIRQSLRDFADWIYRRLEEAYEYTMSDEAVEESIIANEYEFDEDGDIA